jgi:crotonobetainyl-CoA:carnitine CoA-transferase CaiB-like acyl-CoA transferase
MSVFLGMVLVLAVLMALSQRRNGGRFPSGEISFIVVIFLALFLISRL